jgi:hypothetical protein
VHYLVKITVRSNNVGISPICKDPIEETTHVRREASEDFHGLKDEHVMGSTSFLFLKYLRDKPRFGSPGMDY